MTAHVYINRWRLSKLIVVASVDCNNRNSSNTIAPRRENAEVEINEETVSPSVPDE